MRSWKYLCILLVINVSFIFGDSEPRPGLDNVPSGFYSLNYPEKMDLQTKEFLDKYNLFPFTLTDIPIEEMRKSSTISSSDISINPNLEVNNVVINGPEGFFGLRIYKPKVKGPLPTMIFIHGGGWVFGSLNEYDHFCQELCSQGECVIVSVDYHLAPEYPFPKPLEDCYVASKWVVDHINELGGNSKQIAICGDSAGGNLAAAVTLMARDKKEINFNYQMLICPVLNDNFDTLSYYEFGEGYFLTKDFMKFFWNKYLKNNENGRNPYASPLQAKHLSNLPATCIIVADFDPLLDEGLAYGLRLHRDGVVTTIKHYNSIHGFYVKEDLELSNKALSYIAKQLKEHFGKGP